VVIVEVEVEVEVIEQLLDGLKTRINC